MKVKSQGNHQICWWKAGFQLNLTITTLSLSNHTHSLNHKSPFCNLNTPLRVFFADLSHSPPQNVSLNSQPQVCLMSFILIPSILLNFSANHNSARIVYPSCFIPFHVHCSNHKLATLSFTLIFLYKGLSSSSFFPSSSACLLYLSALLIPGPSHQLNTTGHLVNIILPQLEYILENYYKT